MSGTGKVFSLDGVRDFDTDHIFDCGQCFRWNREDDGSYTGTAFGKTVNMRYEAENQRLTVENCTKDEFQNIWRPYLDLDRDYGNIKAELAKADPVIKKAIEAGQGIRILRQDLWETMVSFIISQNNNIPRIKHCIEELCLRFGTEAEPFRGREYYNIPDAEIMAALSEDDLAPCRLGYRAGYLVETARQVTDAGGPDAVAVNLAKAEDPVAELMKFRGVGPKVASCIALFGEGCFRAFPIDVWVRKVMSRMYGIDEKNTKAMAKYAGDHFGAYGGLAQQYLFYYIRTAEIDDTHTAAGISETPDTSDTSI